VCEEGIVASHFSRKLAWRDNEVEAEVEVEVEAEVDPKRQVG
jgi:hypothetical protein